MKIGILSDFHFGYAYTSELEEDSFDNANEAITKALDSDLIIIAGDLFDRRVPKTDVLANAIKILTKPLTVENTGIRLIKCDKELKKISERTLSHLPVVAIHGTHERKGIGQNIVQALENAGILIHLDKNTIVFEKNGKRVAIHGMSGVPERYAKNNLEEWNPKPEEDCFNILLLHQSIDPFIYSPLEPPSLKIENLPRGFDLIVDGHLHIAGQEKFGNTTMIFPGSTISTQLERNEAEAQKGFYKLELCQEVKINFIPLENNRKFFYEEIEIKGNIPFRDQVETKLRDILYKQDGKPPLIKIKIKGKETEILEQDLKELERKYSDRAFVFFVKELESPEISRKIEFLRNLREQKFSVEEIGITLLKDNLDELNFASTFDYEKIFSLLSEGNIDNVFNILIGEQKTLTKVLKNLTEKQRGLNKWVE